MIYLYEILLRIKGENPLLIHALANNISRLEDITDFAEIDRSTAHYHSRNLIREERVIKILWGHCTFSDKNFAPVSVKFYLYLKCSGRKCIK